MLRHPDFHRNLEESPGVLPEHEGGLQALERVLKGRVMALAVTLVDKRVTSVTRTGV